MQTVSEKKTIKANKKWHQYLWRSNNKGF